MKTRQERIENSLSFHGTGRYLALLRGYDVFDDAPRRNTATR